jgi:hypothetical protein
MATNSKTNWISLILAFVVGGIVVVGLRCTSADKPPAEPAPKPATAAPPPGQSQVPCKDAEVVFSLSNPDLVTPDPFVLCQDHGDKGHYKVIWKKAKDEPPSLKTFKAEFTQGTPFVDEDGNPVTTFEWPEQNPSSAKVHTKNLNLNEGQFAYYKYTVDLCCDKDGKTHTLDPGGIIVH